MGNDVLSDVLRTVRLSGAIFYEIRAGARWVTESPSGAWLASRMLPHAQHMIAYHVVTSGSCWVALAEDGARQVRLQSGSNAVRPDPVMADRADDEARPRHRRPWLSWAGTIPRCVLPALPQRLSLITACRAPFPGAAGPAPAATRGVLSSTRQRRLKQQPATGTPRDAPRNRNSCPGYRGIPRFPFAGPARIRYARRR